MHVILTLYEEENRKITRASIYLMRRACLSTSIHTLTHTYTSTQTCIQTYT